MHSTSDIARESRTWVTLLGVAAAKDVFSRTSPHDTSLHAFPTWNLTPLFSEEHTRVVVVDPFFCFFRPCSSSSPSSPSPSYKGEADANPPDFQRQVVQRLVVLALARLRGIPCVASGWLSSGKGDETQIPAYEVQEHVLDEDDDDPPPRTSAAAGRRSPSPLLLLLPRRLLRGRYVCTSGVSSGDRRVLEGRCRAVGAVFQRSLTRRCDVLVVPNEGGWCFAEAEKQAPMEEGHRRCPLGKDGVGGGSSVALTRSYPGSGLQSSSSGGCSPQQWSSSAADGGGGGVVLSQKMQVAQRMGIPLVPVELFGRMCACLLPEEGDEKVRRQKPPQKEAALQEELSTAGRRMDDLSHKRMEDPTRPTGSTVDSRTPITACTSQVPDPTTLSAPPPPEFETRGEVAYCLVAQDAALCVQPHLSRLLRLQEPSKRSYHIQFVTRPEECTHYIVAHPSPTENFLCCMALGRWIVAPSFLVACASAKRGDGLPKASAHEWCPELLARRTKEAARGASEQQAIGRVETVEEPEKREEEERMHLVRGSQLQRCLWQSQHDNVQCCWSGSFAHWRVLLCGGIAPERASSLTHILHCGGCKDVLLLPCAARDAAERVRQQYLRFVWRAEEGDGRGEAMMAPFLEGSSHEPHPMETEQVRRRREEGGGGGASSSAAPTTSPMLVLLLERGSWSEADSEAFRLHLLGKDDGATASEAAPANKPMLSCRTAPCCAEDPSRPSQAVSALRHQGDVGGDTRASPPLLSPLLASTSTPLRFLKTKCLIHFLCAPHHVPSHRCDAFPDIIAAGRRGLPRKRRRD